MPSKSPIPESHIGNLQEKMQVKAFWKAFYHDIFAKAILTWKEATQIQLVDSSTTSIIIFLSYPNQSIKRNYHSKLVLDTF